jgi:ABC-type Fe3+-hydroxamate transport system substrate-binding protein
MTKTTRKLLAVSDDTHESTNALLFAAFRAQALDVGALVLRCARAPAHVGWIGLDRDITQDAMDAARVKAMDHLSRIEAIVGLAPELVVSSSEPDDAIRRLVDEDPAIQMLILAAGSGPRGPGPLVSRLGKGRQLTNRPIPVVVVPPGVTTEQIREMSSLSG